MPSAHRGTVLVTGATSGIGWATAQELATTGWTVFGTSRSLVRRAAVVEDARARRLPLHFIEMDLRDPASVRRGCDRVLDAGPIDALVCNAGAALCGSLEDVPPDAAQQLFELDLWGHVRSITAVVPHMRARRTGRIVIVGSLAGLVPLPYHFHYSAAKAALEVLATTLSLELAGDNIHVCLIRPGEFMTEMHRTTPVHAPPSSPHGARARRAHAAATGNVRRAGPPTQVARVIGAALTARKPRLAYNVGRGLPRLAPVIALLPGRWRAALLEHLYLVAPERP